MTKQTRIEQLLPFILAFLLPGSVYSIHGSRLGELALWQLVCFWFLVSGYLLFIFGIVVWLRGRKSAHAATRFAFNAVMAVLTLQVIWGIFTVLYAAPVHIALIHQALAVVLWVLIIRARFLSGYPIAQSLRGA